MALSPVFRSIGRRPLLVLLVTAMLGLFGAIAASRLKLRTSFSELLPSDDPGVKTLARTQKRIGDMSLLLVGIRSPDPAAAERYADELTTHLRRLPPEICELATYHVRDVRDFIDNNRWLYLSEADLTEARDKIKKEMARRKNPLIADLGLDDEDEPGQTALEQRLRKNVGFASRFPDGLFRNPGGDTLWVAALPPGGLMVENAGEALLAATKAFISSHPPSRYHAQMDVEPSGPIVTPIRNREALSRDLMLVASLCGILIPLSIGLFFRRPLAVLYVAAPAGLATVLAYAVAQTVFGYLTTVTSFLVSFIMGNGTNYAIVLLARYEDERRHGLPVEAATLAAVEATWRATGVAMIASALSYLSLLLTSFRGFSQFGLMGAAGCLFAWMATFTVMPALLRVLDRKRPPARARADAGSGPFGRLATLVERRPGTLALAGVGLTLFCLVGLLHFGRDAFEYDFRKLSARGLIDARVQSFDKDKDALFGRWPQPTVLLADRREDVLPIQAAIRKADAALPGKDVIGQMISVYDLLPGTLPVQANKLELLAEIRKMIDDPALELLPEKQQAELKRFRPPTSLRLLDAKDLPPLARRPFTEVDGSLGKVILMYPPEHGISVYDGRALLRIASVLQRVPLPDGRVVETSGTAVIFASMIRSILRDGPLATAISLGAVLLLVLLRVRPLRSALFVTGALLTGVCWMVGVAGWLDLKITFLNFIALPFIFGVGVEYAIHVVHEYQSHGNVRRTIVSAGGPVALCSWSAIVGYGSLLVARNGALRGLGGVATLGETTCLLAAVVLTPALLIWTTRRRTLRTPQTRAEG